MNPIKIMIEAFFVFLILIAAALWTIDRFYHEPSIEMGQRGDKH